MRCRKQLANALKQSPEILDRYYHFRASPNPMQIIRNRPPNPSLTPLTPPHPRNATKPDTCASLNSSQGTGQFQMQMQLARLRRGQASKGTHGSFKMNKQRMSWLMSHPAKICHLRDDRHNGDQNKREHEHTLVLACMLLHARTHFTLKLINLGFVRYRHPWITWIKFNVIDAIVRRRSRDVTANRVTSAIQTSPAWFVGMNFGASTLHIPSASSVSPILQHLLSNTACSTRI